MKTMGIKALLTGCVLAWGVSGGATPARADVAGPETGKWAVGLQSTFPTWGLSGQYKVSDTLSVQGIIGGLGDLKVYGVRGLYRFDKKPNYRLYGYGGLGIYRYTGVGLGAAWIRSVTESVVGFGAGAGIEYFHPKLPQVGWNLELGLAAVSFSDVNYTVGGFTTGVGAHYYF